jgi:hypothetical protein
MSALVRMGGREVMPVWAGVGRCGLWDVEYAVRMKYRAGDVAWFDLVRDERV